MTRGAGGGVGGVRNTNPDPAIVSAIYEHLAFVSRGERAESGTRRVARQTGHSPSAGALFPTLSLLIP